MPRKGYTRKQPEQDFYHHCNTYLNNCDFWLRLYCETSADYSKFWRQNDQSGACETCKEAAKNMAIASAVSKGIKVK